MGEFLVSARKYRPEKFEDVVGQEQVTITLKNAIKNSQLGQAFLFCGPRGIGKTTCARILAKTINCENLSDDFEACGSCRSCKSFKESASFNIHELDAASHNSVEDIRTLIDQIRFMPQEGKYKTYIIDEVHMLSAQAFNAFLKTLEEPPPYAIFILATTEKQKILPTILSRCQIYDFNRIKVADIVSYLEKICVIEQIGFEKEALHIISTKADGALRDALSMFDRIVSFSEGNLTLKAVLSSLNILDYDYYFKFIDAFLSEDRAEVLLLYNEIQEAGFEGDILLYGLSKHFRDLLVCKTQETLKLLDIPEGLVKRYSEQATYTPESLLMTWLNIANRFEIDYRNSRDKRLHVELALLKMVYVRRAVKEDIAMIPVKKNQQVKLADTEPKVDEEKRKNVIKERFDKDAPGPESLQAAQVEEETPAPTPESSNDSFLGGVKLTSYEAISQEPSMPSETEAQKEVGVPDPLPGIKLIEEGWKECAEHFEHKDKMSLAAIIRDHKPEIVNDGIIVKLNNKVNLELLSSEKDLLSRFLARKLKLNHLTIQLELDKQRENARQSRKPFTSSEKFDKMKEKNPTIEDLKDRLDLDLEY